MGFIHEVQPFGPRCSSKKTIQLCVCVSLGTNEDQGTTAASGISILSDAWTCRQVNLLLRAECEADMLHLVKT